MHQINSKATHLLMHLQETHSSWGCAAASDWGTAMGDKPVNHSCLHLLFLLLRCVAISCFTSNPKYSGPFKYNKGKLFLTDDWRLTSLTYKVLFAGPFYSMFQHLHCSAMHMLPHHLSIPVPSLNFLSSAASHSQQSFFQTFQAQWQNPCTKYCKLLRQELFHDFC